MKKTSKAISLLLMLVLLVGALPLTAIPVSAATSVKNENALVNAINKGNDVTLKANILLADTVTIPEGISITLDLNGYSLDRGLDFEVEEEGSVILVEEGAELYIKDNSGNNAGMITGGASYVGGGICNYGTLTVQGGTISGNCAYDETDGLGGGIYNEGELTILGGVITENEANYGGGIANAGGTMTMQQSTYLKKVGVNSTEIIMNVEITGNYAEDAKSHGVFNSGTWNIEGSPNISGNEDNDVYLSYGKKMNITGELDIEEPIGVQVSGTNPTFTSGFKTNVSGDPSDYFTSTVDGALLQLDSSGEAMLQTEEKSKVIVYQNGSMTNSAEYSSVSDAWSAATGYAQNDSGKTRVEITLGGNYTISEKTTLSIGEGKTIVLDLNGHYIKRSLEAKNSNVGRVFEVANKAKFTVKDSNPDAKGYDGVKGGVITNDNGGAIEVKGGGTFEMLGGTLYKCSNAYYSANGGGVLASGDSPITITMKDCSIRSCSTGATYKGDGGAIYYAPKNTTDSGGMTLENVSLRNNSSAKDGSAILLSKTPGKVRIIGCYFSGNSAGKYGGGAIALYDPDKMSSSDSPTVDLLINNSVFYNNSGAYSGVYFSEFETDQETAQKNEAENNGGGNGSGYGYNDYNGGYSNNGYGNGGSAAVDNRPENDSPAIFRNCTMKNNSASGTEENKNVASVIYADASNPIVIDGGEITNNSGGKGAIIVLGKSTVSVSGKVIIKDNTDSSGSAAPGFIRYFNGMAIVYSAGLDEGSYIEVGSQSSGSYAEPLVKNISQYEKDYFHGVGISLSYSKTGTETAAMATASIFGSGSWIAICVLIAIAAAAAIITVIIVKKKRRGGAKDAVK